MSKYISYPKGGLVQVNDNPWQVIREPYQTAETFVNGNFLISYQDWIEHHAPSENRTAPSFGVYFSVEDDVFEERQRIKRYMHQWQVIAVDFPIFRDGRGFSTAAILRETFMWDKELIAIGDVLIDQLIQLSRVGFDGFVLRDDQHLAHGVSQLSRFPVKMQNDWRGFRTQRLVECV